jgi:hypothetical protein
MKVHAARLITFILHLTCAEMLGSAIGTIINDRTCRFISSPYLVLALIGCNCATDFIYPPASFPFSSP